MRDTSEARDRFSNRIPSAVIDHHNYAGAGKRPYLSLMLWLIHQESPQVLLWTRQACPVTFHAGQAGFLAHSCDHADAPADNSRARATAVSH